MPVGQRFFVPLLLLLFNGAVHPGRATVVLEIEGIRSDEGQLIIAVFRNEEDFRNEHPAVRKRYSKAGLQGDKMTITLQLSPGSYGIAVLDDENLDDDMTLNFIGYPREGFAFSGFEQKGLAKPRFDQFCFVLEEASQKRVKAQLKYL